MTEDEEQALNCQCGHRKDDHWLFYNDAGKVCGSVPHGRGSCAASKCSCRKFLIMPRWHVGNILMSCSPEDLRFAAESLRTGWSRFNDEIINVAALLHLMAASATDTWKESK